MPAGNQILKFISRPSKGDALEDCRVANVDRSLEYCLMRATYTDL
jgi:hypothetical protein